MKSKKLLARLSAFMGADPSTQRSETRAIKRVLKALKEKERELKKKLENAPEEERAALQTKLDVIYAQRTKGVERVRELKDSKP